MTDEVKDSTVTTSAETVSVPVEAPVVVDDKATAAPEAPVAETTVVTEPVPTKRKAGRPRKDAAKAALVAAPKAEKPAPAAPAPVQKAKPAPKTTKAPEASVSPKPVAAAKPVKAKPVKSPAIKTPVAKAPVVKATRPVTVKTATAKPAAIKPVAAKSAPVRTSVKPAAAAAPAPRKELFIMANTTEFTDKLQTTFKDAAEKAKAAFEKSQGAFGEAGEFAKGNVEALVESGKILASGLQELGKGYVSEGKASFETMSADIKELASAKSPTEFFEKQSALLRKQFDAVVATSSKNSEAFLKLANEAFQPISTRVSLAVEKVKKAA